MTVELPLEESASGIADANGRAVARLQPLRAFEAWRVNNMTVQSTSTLVPEARVYRGSENPSTLQDGTYSGNFDVSTVDMTIPNGVALICVWSGCTPGATCTLTISGVKLAR